MVREMRIADIPDIVNFSAKAYSKSAYRNIDLDIGVFMEFCKKSVLSSDTRAWVAENGGKVVGVLIAQVFPLYFSKKMFATERFFVVSDEGRGMGARLLFRFMSWAKAHPRVSTVILYASANMPQQAAVERLYGKIGNRTGSIFQAEV